MLTKWLAINSTFDLRRRAAFVACAFALVLLAASTGLRAQTFSTLHTFTGGADGDTPYAGMTIDQAGNFYGTTSVGGAGYGTVYKLTRSGSGWILSTLYKFQGGTDGAYPYARVVFGPDGALYGTTSDYGSSDGNGTVFRLQPPSRRCASVSCPWVKTMLYRFTGGADGSNPGYGDLVFDAAGNLYGTTMSGGGEGGNCSPYDNCGVVFKLTRSGGSWTESVLYTFDQTGDAGFLPEAGVILDSTGNLYGTTLLGGANSQGVTFQLTQSGSAWNLTVLHSFGGNGDGAQPYGGLAIDRQGNLYGTTVFGTSQQNGGTVYELQPSGGNWTYSILADLPPAAVGPEAAPTIDSAGNLYATTYSGGSHGLGNVFKLTPAEGAWTYTDLHDFTGHDGGYPAGNIVLDGQGNLYSTASNYLNGHGTSWQLAP